MKSDKSNEEGQTRRSLLKKSAFAAGLPVILSLAPDEARAAGSWQNAQSTGYEIQPGQNPNITQAPGNTYTVPFSHGWRQRREGLLRRARAERQLWNGLGGE